jgi:short-subunit dehydrogenase
MSASRTLVLFGSGPGIGNNVASEFVSHGFNHVILLARNETRLQDDAATVAKAGSNVKVDTIRLDLSKLDTIPAVLKKIDELAKQVDVVFFNAARIQPSEPLATSVEEIDEDFRVGPLFSFTNTFC